VLGLMRALAAGGTTMLIATHELGFARAAASRVITMSGGRVASDRTAAAHFAPASATAGSGRPYPVCPNPL
jgi:glutamate transport system ATP-binding protein